MLRGEALWVRHGRRSPWVLEGVDIAVVPGKVTGLTAPSGRGKSTLAGVLAGFRMPDRGRVSLDGRERRASGGPRPVQLVLQHPERAMNPRWTVRRILAEAHPDGADLSVHRRDLVHEDWLDRYPHEISGGELQRVNLARALLTRPRYLLADEISTSLDPLAQAILWQHVLAEVADHDLGILAISHDRVLLDQVADEILTLP